MFKAGWADRLLGLQCWCWLELMGLYHFTRNLPSRSLFCHLSYYIHTYFQFKNYCSQTLCCLKALDILSELTLTPPSFVPTQGALVFPDMEAVEIQMHRAASYNTAHDISSANLGRSKGQEIERNVSLHVARTISHLHHNQISS